MPGPDRVVEHRLAAGADEQLDPPRRLTQSDPRELALGQPGREADRLQRVDRDGHHRHATTEALALGRLHLDSPAALRDGSHLRAESPLERRRRSDRAQERTRSLRDQHPTPRELRQGEAVSRERVPAQHRDSAGVVEGRVCQRLEFGDQDRSFFGVEVELIEALFDRQSVEAPQLFDRVQGVVRQRERLLDPVDEAVPSALGDCVALLDRRCAPLAIDVPARSFGVVSQRDGEPRTRQLREGVWLVPVNPRPAILDLASIPGRTPCSAAEPVARLEQQDGPSPERGLTRRGDPGEAAADDDHVVYWTTSSSSTAAPAAETARRRMTASTAMAPCSSTSTGLSSTSASEASTSTSPVRCASRESAPTSTGGWPRPPNSRRAPRNSRSARSMRDALAGKGTITTSAITSVQIPPIPITRAGTRASARAATSSSTPGPIISSATTVPPHSAARAERRPYTAPASSTELSPSATAPSSDLC